MFAKISLMLALALGLAQNSLSAQVRRPLSQTVIIVDPGHGGHDPLAALSPLLEYDNRLVRLSEAEYAMDVGLRLRYLARETGVPVVMTVHNSQQTDTTSSGYIPRSYGQVFSHNSEPVSRRRLRERLAIVRQVRASYPNHRIVFVSLHFNRSGPDISGMFAIVPRRMPTPPMLAPLLQEFQALGLSHSRNGRPASYQVLTNGDRRIYVRTLMMLRGPHDPNDEGDYNQADESVIIELGNFSNRNDARRYLDPNLRQAAARAVFRSIARTALPEIDTSPRIVQIQTLIREVR